MPKRIINIFLLLISVTILSACGRPGSGDGEVKDVVAGSGDIAQEDATEEIAEKKELFVDVQTLGDVVIQPSITKSGKIEGKNEVTVTAKVGGRVSGLTLQEGDVLRKGGSALQLLDSNDSFNFSKQQARESVESAKLTYVSNKVNLDNALTDLRLTVKQAQQNYDTIVADAAQERKDLEQQLADAERERQQAQYSASSNDLDTLNSVARLQLEQFEEEIANAEFDYQTKLDADTQTLEGFVNSAEVLQQDVANIYESITDGVDQIIGLSEENRNANDAYERYLGAKDTETRLDAREELRRVMQRNIKSGDTNYSLEDVRKLPDQLKSLDDSLDGLDELLSKVDLMLTNTITGNFLSQQALDGLKAQIDGYQSQLTAVASSSVSQINSIESFLVTYQQNQESLLNNIDLLKTQRKVTAKQLIDASVNSDFAVDRSDIGVERTSIGIQRAIIALDNSIATAKLSLESAQNAVSAQEKTRSASLDALQNSIDQAEISYDEIVSNSNKLKVTAAIDGTIGDVLINEGEEVSPGTPLFTQISTDQQEIVIRLTDSEQDVVREGTRVQILIDNDIIDGRIETISGLADDQLLYKTTIIPQKAVDNIGNILSVKIPVSSGKTIIPLEYITMISTKQGQTWIWDDVPQKRSLQLGKVRGNGIEVLTDLDDNTQIITSPMNSYDENIYEAVRKQ